MTGILKVNKDKVKSVVGSILGGEEEKELDLKKSHNKFHAMKNQIIRFRSIFMMLSKTTIFTRFPKERGLLMEYVDLIDRALEEFFGNPPDLGNLVQAYPMIPKDKSDIVINFLSYYAKSKKSPIKK